MSAPVDAVDHPQDPSPAELEGSDLRGSGAAEEITFRYERSPRDVLRLVVFAVTSIVVTLLTIGVEDSIIGLERDLIQVFDFLSPSAERIIHGAIEWFILGVGVIVYLVPLVTKRYRLFGYVLAANVTAFGLMSLVGWLIDRTSPDVFINEIAERAGLSDAAASSAPVFAQLAASFIAVGPFVTRRWRLAGAVTFVVLMIMRLLVTVQLPAELVVAAPVGATCGAGVLLLFGRPDRRPTLAAIRTALRSSGLPVTEVHPAKVDARGSTPYFATLEDGNGMFVKILGDEERAADLLFRVYRFLRLKDVGDDRPFSSLRRTVEHEALVSLLARDVGLRTPRMRGVVKVGDDAMLLAYDLVDGSSLDGVPDDEVTDELMRGVWEQIAALRRHRIAHRDLRRANVFVDADGSPWLIDFGFSELAVGDGLLDADVAQMLASFVVVAGPERTVGAAIDVLGAEAVADALPRLQVNALSGATQTALKQQKGLLKELQREVIDRCEISDVHFQDLDRVNRKTIFTIVLLALITYFLIPQFADLPGIIDQVRDADWGWTPAIVLASIGTYVFAAASVLGAVPDRLPAGTTFSAQIAGSFASKLAPAGLGGMALNVRYMQKHGVDQAVAVASVGLNTIAGVVGHLSLVGVFLVWAGRDAFGSFELPDPKWFLIGIGVAVAMIAIGLLIPALRRVLTDRLFPVLKRSFDGVSSVLRRPSKVALLLIGSAGVTFTYLLTLYLSTQAFGGTLPLATVGAVFLVGSAVAQAAPTPGGLGAMEAALIGGLVAAGMDNSVAVPAVFLYRLATFWLPILPGWLLFTWLERHDHL